MVHLGTARRSPDDVPRPVPYRVARVTLDAWKSLAGFVIATVGGLAGLALSVLGFAGVTAPGDSRGVFMVIGAVIGTFSIAAFVTGLWWFLRLPTKDPLASADMVIGTHVTRWARSAEDINNAYALFVRLLPGDSPVSLPIMHALFAYNPETVFVVERAEGASRQLVGMGIIAPITSEACRQVLAKEFRSVSDVDLSTHVQPDWVSPAGVYVGGAAADPKDRTSAVRVLDYIAILSNMSAARHVFAHPASPQGKRIMEHAGFYPIGDGTPMWALQGRRMLDYRSDGHRRTKDPHATGVPSPSQVGAEQTPTIPDDKN